MSQADGREEGVPLDKWEERTGCLGTPSFCLQCHVRHNGGLGWVQAGRRIQSVTVDKSLNSTLPCFPSAEWV